MTVFIEPQNRREVAILEGTIRWLLCCRVYKPWKQSKKLSYHRFPVAIEGQGDKTRARARTRKEGDWPGQHSRSEKKKIGNLLIILVCVVTGKLRYCVE